MPQSLAKVLLHITFSTKHREPLLRDKTVREGLYAYGAGVLKEIECPAIILGGIADHMHTLCLLSRKITLAKLIETAYIDMKERLKAEEA